jgi:transcriptional regulator with XRE-family HTH domain
MTSSSSLRQFLMSRRAQIDPESVGLPPSPTPRRRSGLRREEVAALAGVSVDYYARLEQGRVGNVSDQVLTAIENALQLDALERQHLRALVQVGAAAMASVAMAVSVRHGLRSLLDTLDPIPALLQNHRLDVHYANGAAKILLTDFDAMPARQRNIARWLFLDPEARTRYPQWEQVAEATVGALRAAYDPRRVDDALEALVGELSLASVEFARFWSDYRLFKHSHGVKKIHHDIVGCMTLNYETLDISGSDGQYVCTYTAERGSPSAEKLRTLMSWHARSVDEGDISARAGETQNAPD